MMLNAINDNANEAKMEISKLQRQRDTGEITEDEFEDKYNAVMDRERFRFFAILDWRSLEAYNTYKNEGHTITPSRN